MKTPKKHGIARNFLTALGAGLALEGIGSFCLNRTRASDTMIGAAKGIVGGGLAFAMRNRFPAAAVGLGLTGASAAIRGAAGDVSTQAWVRQLVPHTTTNSNTDAGGGNSGNSGNSGNNTTLPATAATPALPAPAATPAPTAPATRPAAGVHAGQIRRVAR